MSKFRESLIEQRTQTNSSGKVVATAIETTTKALNLISEADQARSGRSDAVRRVIARAHMEAQVPAVKVIGRRILI